MIKNIVVITILCLFIGNNGNYGSTLSLDDCLSCWARKLGKELVELGKIITKSSEIKYRYRFLNAEVEEKNPHLLLAEIIENIARMMDRKMDAVKCIVQKAEEAAKYYKYNRTEAEEFTYYNSKFSNKTKDDNIDDEDDVAKYYDMYPPFELNPDKHFYNLAVDTNHSSVHVPANVFDRYNDTLVAIQWSEELDEVFKNNYNSDPSLSWQYFASSTGVMRHFPGMKWNIPVYRDEFDARIRTWFIEAATCTKDAIILLDNSGSMTGMSNHIAKFTVRSILDTFSNNDYINVLNYSTHVNYTVECFEDILVQATNENIGVFKGAIDLLKPNDKSNLAPALNYSLALLKKYRDQRGCDIDTCNQAIMIVTDGVTENFAELFEQYNSIYNGPERTVPVRIFTYLVGKEVSHEEEIKEMACFNRGYYSHIDSLEQVTASVFNYVMVIARPLVIQAEDHPASWTHAYPDQTAKIVEGDNKQMDTFRLLTSVAVPAFDTTERNENETREAKLLGVAGTDVPIDDIGKLSLPYKLGVNAYSFVVSNNGYVLMHPDLRPIFEGRLKENSNSVDFTEVEQHYEQTEPRVITETLENLRTMLVNGVKGSMHNLTLKYHYDDNRRISKETYDYYFAPLNSTPFSVGIAIPSTYGRYQIGVGDQIQKNKHTGIRIEKYFDGNNWKVHPKWVYCRYHYPEGHEYENPEKELLHFLEKMSILYREFKWRRQYEAMSTAHNEEGGFEKEDLDAVECGRAVLNQDDYYCDKQLVNRLIFDATSTFEYFKEPWKFKDEIERELFERYNASLRFVATTSGLTRWEYIFGEDENTTRKEFGDWHAKAVNENWYKNAILHHQWDRESFVYAVPFDSGESNDILVTGSYAIFHSDGGKEAPAAVVGFQFSHEALASNFFKITQQGNCLNCVPCGEELNCYIIDAYGYIVVSYNQNDTGRFFGEIEGAVMESLEMRQIFEKITIYDFQGVCIEPANKPSLASILETPIAYISWGVKFILGKIFWGLVELHLWELWDPSWVYADEESEEEEIQIRSCDTKRDLYVVNSNIFLPGHKYDEKTIEGSRAPPYYIKRIPNSNLILVAVNATVRFSDMVFQVKTEEIVYVNITSPCQKLNLNNLTRRRLSGCYNYDPLENEIKDCGGSSSTIYLSSSLVVIYIIIAFFA